MITLISWNGDVRDQLYDGEDSLTGFTGLHAAAYFGSVEIAVALLDIGGFSVQATYHERHYSNLLGCQKGV